MLRNTPESHDHTDRADPAAVADEAPAGPPSVREIAALTARLRELRPGGALADDPAARAAFLADKHALLDRLPTTDTADDAADTGEDADEAPARSHTHAAVTRDPAHRADDRDADGWFASGADAAHTAYLQQLAHTHADDTADPTPPADELPTGVLVERAHHRTAALATGDTAAVDAERDRRAQLAAWHTTDNGDSTAAADGAARDRDDALTRGDHP